MQAPVESGAATAQDFIAARRQAGLEVFLARLRGRSTALLSYEDVRAKLHAIESSGQVLREIALDDIVGSVGRYADFTRSFLPKSNADRQRWAQVKAVADGLTGFPPIEVYQIGEVYFVRDGNHRVSVARQSDATHIQAYVTCVRSDVPLEANVRPEDLILKAEYADFLEATGFRTVVPAGDIILTAPGQYRKLQEQIEVHRYFMGVDQKREIPYADAVKDWYEGVYLPQVDVINQCGILLDFPDRTKGDLYLCVSEHRQRLQESLDIAVPLNEVVCDLATQFSPEPRRVATRIGARIVDWITPDPFEGGPRPGHWRRERLEPRSNAKQIFPEILLPLGNQPEHWESLEQARVIAGRDNAHVHGLHVRRPAADDPQRAEALRAVFLERCIQAGLKHTFHYELGKIPRQVNYWSRWMDLIVLSLQFAPQPGPTRRFGSGLRTILHRCPCPVLTVPAKHSQLQCLLLAFNGSPKAWEALYLAGYLNATWEVPLHVVHVRNEKTIAEDALENARSYLQDHEAVVYQQIQGTPDEVLLAVAQDVGADMILMGGYTAHPLVEIFLGSTVERMLRHSTIPLLICR